MSCEAILYESSERFSPAWPESVGMSPQSLGHAVETARVWVDDGRIVGAVMLVIRRNRIVLHEAVGWSDRERQIPMKTDTIFMMRSMTKPLLGTTILMLNEEGRLTLQDSVSKYLPAFDNERSRDITIYQLLTHTSGITGSIVENNGSRYASLREAVDEVGRRGPEHPPGTRYEYSDPGSSTLGAVVAEISGMPVEDFIRTRILEPLAMGDSFLDFKLQPDDPRAGRVAASYCRENGGETGPWTKSWDNTQPEEVPFFRASGGLFASGIDYAKFLSCTLDGGRFGERRLLSEETVRLATSPGLVSKEYGLQWQVFGDNVFGHGGFQGTLSWVDKANDLIGLYLTQSESTGNATRPEFKKLVERAIVK
ncbi:serine hydrolase domain-containing protein [Rhizobium mongolense]|uniref:CubicO group peptidase (Beta-lactamase class C family) n=2 Tax=Rhizobium mongolense TaxID=57676 RepID=A0ABR6IYJ0_9HYPH|nr:serine hydrolase domain-containing protein [Rhizobium mongolense]MBB4232967.1 CubicO group peptidase (beta-lactamase class C family) [Rhizobium mongolense]TVZ75102.1 CubicO group peptidase (beta-lactamase class C family) [Rhizobium mongolense USDA 1844]